MPIKMLHQPPRLPIISPGPPYKSMLMLMLSRPPRCHEHLQSLIQKPSEVYDQCISGISQCGATCRGYSVILLMHKPQQGLIPWGSGEVAHALPLYERRSLPVQTQDEGSWEIICMVISDFFLWGSRLMKALEKTWHVACPLPGQGYIPNKPKHAHKQTASRGKCLL